ncbi:hypothetical protein ACNHFS_004719, partial [Yersinia enterocolitica]
MNNIEELSKPVAWTNAEELADLKQYSHCTIWSVDRHQPGTDETRKVSIYSQGYVDALIAQLEAAQKELSAANEKLSRHIVVRSKSGAVAYRYKLKNDFCRWAYSEGIPPNKSDKFQEELLFTHPIRASIELPDVELGKYWFEHDGRNIFDGVEFNNDVISAIKAAGFTVEGEPAPVKYIVILQRAWCNDSGSGINYHSDLIEFDKRDKAIKHGFELQDSDDFNIGVLTNGVLTSFDWMAKPLAETKDSLARIASGIG